MSALADLRESVAKQLERFSQPRIYGQELRVATTCVLPSFECLYLQVSKIGERYMVHDCGETLESIVRHGQEPDIAERVIRRMCHNLGLDFNGWRISWESHDPNWISSGILAVAAAATGSADCALHEMHLKAQEARNDEKADSKLADAVFSLLEPSLKEGTISRKFPHRGKSGRSYEFDLSVQERDRLTLIETVTPRVDSVSSKYIALSDVSSERNIRKIVAHDDELPEEDIKLLRNVATVASANDVGRMVAA